MKIIRILSSVRLFFGLSAALLAAFVIGGILPQGLSPQEYGEMFGRIGGGWIARLRLYDVFSSRWFLVLMAAGGVNLLACTFRRWKLIRTRPGVFIGHLAVILLFAGGAVRSVYRTGGVLAMETGETRSEFVNAEGAVSPLPFEVRLRDFRITYWEPERHFIHAIGEEGEILESLEAGEGKTLEFKSVPVSLKILKFYPNFSIGKGGPLSLDESRTNPALTIMLRDGKKARPAYLFARYPDYHGTAGSSGVRLIYELRSGRIKQFESVVDILEKGGLKKEALLSVNSPLYYKGYRLYQAGYDESRPGFSSIQVSKDPSVPVMYAGFALLMAGLSLAFWKEIK